MQKYIMFGLKTFQNQLWFSIHKSWWQKPLRLSLLYHYEFYFVSTPVQWIGLQLFTIPAMRSGYYVLLSWKQNRFTQYILYFLLYRTSWFFCFFRSLSDIIFHLSTIYFLLFLGHSNLQDRPFTVKWEFACFTNSLKIADRLHLG